MLHAITKIRAELTKGIGRNEVSWKLLVHSWWNDLTLLYVSLERTGKHVIHYLQQCVCELCSGLRYIVNYSYIKPQLLNCNMNQQIVLCSSRYIV